MELPYETVKFDEKIVYTVGSAIIYLMGQIPLYGLIPNAQFHLIDPFYSIRPIFAMEKASLLELGFLPIITSAFIWQLAAGLKLININLGLRYDRELFQLGQKLTAWGLALIFSVGLIYSGYYDNVIRGYKVVGGSGGVPIWSYLIIFTQIFTWQIVLTLIVEIFDKGYGFGSGILSFLALQNATSFIAELVGLEMFPVVNNTLKFESLGALLNLVRNFSIFSPTTTINQIWHAFTRVQLPNLTQFYITLATILAVVLLQNFRTEISIRSTKVRGMNQMFPIRLLYTGGLPVLFAYTVIANLQVFGFIFEAALVKLTASPIVSTLFANYVVEPYSNRLVIKSGVLYFFTASQTLLQSIISPLRVVIYSSTVVGLAIWFAYKWSYIAGSSPKDISKQFKEQGISIAGKRDISITKEFAKIIPTAAVTGAFILSALAVTGDYLGGLGRNVASIVGVSSAFGILEEFMIDYQQAGGSQFQSAISGFQ